MAEQLYIRVRGRVMGPYDRDKLRALVKRGQLGRLHQVSEDGVTWVRATSFPDLFVSSASNGNVARVQESPSQLSSLAGIDLEPEYPVTGAESAKSHTPGQQGWYYTSAGGQAGPVDFGTLQRMVAGGQLSPSDLVWTDGMSQWTAPNLVPGLLSAAGAQSHSASAAFSPQNLAYGDGEREHSEKRCPFCAELIASQAIKCKHCGTILISLGQESERTASGNWPPNGVVVPVLISAISNVIIGLVYVGTFICFPLGLPLFILCIFEFMLYAGADKMTPKTLRSRAKILGIFELVLGLINLVSLICGIVVLINSSKIQSK